MNQPKPKIQGSAREFTMILIAAVMLSFAFVQWFGGSRGATFDGGLEVGKQAPELKADYWVKGEAPTPDDLQGEVYVVVAWATWCLPCYQTAPELVKIEEKFSSEGVRFFGITAAGPQQENDILEWLDDRKITWPNGFGVSAVNTLIEFDGEAIPAMWIIGRDGKVWWNRGMIEQESMEDALRRTLAESRPVLDADPAESGA